jgi:plastocyanin
MSTQTALRGVIGITLLVAVAFVTQQSATAAEVGVQVGDVWFCDESYEGGVCETTIDAGDTVVWDFEGANQPHTTTACGADCDAPTNSPLWDSGIIPGNSTGNDALFEFTFDQPGTYLYYCEVHPFLQRGKIVVQGAGGAVGDANCNGSVDSIDAALILQFSASLTNSLPCQQNADVNASGAIDSIDAALVLQHTAGLLPSLPP